MNAYSDYYLKFFISRHKKNLSQNNTSPMNLEIIVDDGLSLDDIGGSLREKNTLVIGSKRKSFLYFNNKISREAKASFYIGDIFITLTIECSEVNLYISQKERLGITSVLKINPTSYLVSLNTGDTIEEFSITESGVYLDIPYEKTYGKIDSSLVRFPLERLVTGFSHPITERPFGCFDEAVEIVDKISHEINNRLDVAQAKKMVLGLSGGLDSTLVLLMAHHTVKRFGRKLDDIIVVTLPSGPTSSRSLMNSRRLTSVLGLTLLEIPIGDESKRLLNLIGHDGVTTDITYENTQARLRTLLLLNIANLNNGIMLGTGDMSEAALGWCTFGGDQIAMFNPNGGLPKTAVQDLVRYFAQNESLRECLIDVLEAPISPELKDNQQTEDSIGKYLINDFIMYHLIGLGKTKSHIRFLLMEVFALERNEADFYVDRFINRFTRSSFKRVSMPEFVSIFNCSFDRREIYELIVEE